MTHPCYLYPYLNVRDWEWARLMLEQWHCPRYGRWHNHGRAIVCQKWVAHRETPHMISVARRIRRDVLDEMPAP